MLERKQRKRFQILPQPPFILKEKCLYCPSDHQKAVAYVLDQYFANGHEMIPICSNCIEKIDNELCIR